MKRYLLILFASVLCLACSEEIEPDVTASGTLVKNEVSFFMYGTHLLVQGEGSPAYALKSTTVNLDNYLNQKVKISGKIVTGYPVDGGPEYVDVGRVVAEKD